MTEAVAQDPPRSHAGTNARPATALGVRWRNTVKAEERCMDGRLWTEAVTEVRTGVVLSYLSHKGEVNAVVRSGDGLFAVPLRSLTVSSGPLHS